MLKCYCKTIENYKLHSKLQQKIRKAIKRKTSYGNFKILANDYLVYKSKKGLTSEF